MGKKSRIIVGLPEGGYIGLCVGEGSVFFESEGTAKKHGRKPPFQTELPPGMASEVYDSPDKIPADFCITGSAATTAPVSMSAKAAAPKPAAPSGGTMKAMDTTCYYINGMIVCDP